ncbi:MAG: PHP domain-containing protein [Clostridia bacterium]|nr:PHP domain-containing protein [Clostridia bacterium]
MKLYYDLHMHSCLSPCADDDMTPMNMAGMGMLKGLSVMALTDHNSCRNCPAFFKACEGYGIVPIAGMELSTAEDVHMVVLFPTLEAALSFEAALEEHRMATENDPAIFGNQLVMNEKDEVISEFSPLLIAATDLWMGEAVEMVRSFGGVIYPAHIDRDSNGIIAMLGDIPPEYAFTAM